jgi:thymidylate synthase (FAD)
MPLAAQLDLVAKLLDLGHTSPLEHCSMTFYLPDVSRACLDQLNRYRIASVCMESQRYVDMETRPSKIPDSITLCAPAHSLVADHIKRTNEVYRTLVDEHKIPKEDARSIIEMGRMCNEVFTCNLREFMHIRKERLCTQAQSEIRALVLAMSQKVKTLWPTIDRVFSHERANPPCKNCINTRCLHKG